MEGETIIDDKTRVENSEIATPPALVLETTIDATAAAETQVQTAPAAVGEENVRRSARKRTGKGAKGMEAIIKGEKLEAAEKQKEEKAKKRKTTHRKETKLKSEAGEPRLYCICRTSNEEGRMIQCEKCEEWFHLSCVGISQRQCLRIGPYFCVDCSTDPQANSDPTQPTTTAPIPVGSPNPTAPQDDDVDTTSNGVTATNDGTGFPGRISLPDVVVLKRRMPSADLGQKKKFVRQCARPTCVNLINLEELYCSQECAEQSQPLGSPTPPPPHATRRKTSELQPVNPEVQPVAAATVGAKRKHSNTASDSPLPKDPLRKMVVDKFTTALTEALEGQVEKEGLVSKDEAQKLACQIEYSLFEHHATRDKNDRLLPQDKYKSRFRAMIQNFNDQDNYQLRIRILDGRITPEQFAILPNEALVSEKIRALTREVKQRAIQESIIKDVEGIAFVKKTHKGETFAMDLKSHLTVNTSLAAVEKQQKQQQQRKRNYEDDYVISPGGVSMGSSVNATMGDPLDTVLAKIGGGTVEKAGKSNEDYYHSNEMNSIIHSANSPVEPLDFSFIDDNLASIGIGVGGGVVSTGGNSGEFSPAMLPADTPPPRSPQIDATTQLDVVWNGRIIFENKLPGNDAILEFTCDAVQLGGPTISQGRKGWDDILQTNVNIDGRISPKVVDEYALAQMRTGSKDLLVLQFRPSFGQENDYLALWECFVEMQRYAVVGYHYVTVKDIYILPLAEGEAVPEFLREALEEHPIRGSVLLGVIIRIRQTPATALEWQPSDGFPMVPL